MIQEVLTNQQRQFIQLAISSDWHVRKIFQQGKEKPSTLAKLRLGQKNIRTIPKCFRCLSSLTELNLAGNKITTIENLKQLTSLITLRVGVNKIAKIQMMRNPSRNNCCCFQSLKCLQLRSNIIETIQGILYIKMPNISRLQLDHNNISNFRVLRRASLHQIQDLRINNNKVKQFISFNEFKSEKLKDFRFGEYNVFGKKQQNEMSKIWQILIFKLELSQLEFAKEKQKVWSRHQKRTNLIKVYQNQDKKLNSE